MEVGLIEKVATNGIFAMLFVGLLLYVLKQNERRERVLMAGLEKLTQLYETIKDSVSGIEETLRKEK